jgi:hypothetical protein
MAKSKLVLDHLVLGLKDEEELKKSEISSIIKFGAEAIFESLNDENTFADEYDDAKIGECLDRDALIEKAKEEEDKPEGHNPFASSMKMGDGKSKIDTADPGEKASASSSKDLEKEDAEFWGKLLGDGDDIVKEDAVLERSNRRKKDVQYTIVIDPDLDDPELERCVFVLSYL